MRYAVKPVQAVFGIPDSEGFVVLQATSAFLNYVESFGNVIQADFAECNISVKDVDEAATGERLDSVVVCIQTFEDGFLGLIENFMHTQIAQSLANFKIRVVNSSWIFHRFLRVHFLRVCLASLPLPLPLSRFSFRLGCRLLFCHYLAQDGVMNPHAF